MINHPQLWFQQDGTTAHTSRETIVLLLNIFGERIISRGSFNWSSHSPELTVPDFFFGGYLKEIVYMNKLETILQLKFHIQEEIQ